MSTPEESDAVLRLAGTILRLWRRRAGLGQDDYGQRIGYSVDLVSSVEVGRRVPTAAYLKAADRVCDARGVIITMAPHIRDRPRPQHEVRPSEATSTALSYYAPILLPDLFLVDPVPDAAPTARARILDAGNPICLVLDESVLTRTVGDQTEHAQQLQHLAELADRPHITIQVLPLNSGEPLGLTAPVTLLREDDQPAAYVDTGVGVCWLGPEAARAAEEQFATLRSVALPPRASHSLILNTAARIGE